MKIKTKKKLEDINNSIQDNLKLKTIIRVVSQRTLEADISDSSSVIAYYLLLSLLPLILMLGSIVTLFDFKAQLILPYLQEIFPTGIYQLIMKPAEKLLSSQPEGFLFVISAIITIWAVSRGVNGLQKILNRIYGVEEKYNFIIRRLFNFGMTFVFFVAMILLAIVISFGNTILEYFQRILHFDIKFISLFTTLKWPVTFIMLFIITIIMYTLIPNNKIKLRDAIPGSLFTTIGWIILAQVFGIFAHHLAIKYASYGVIGTMIIVILWLKLAAIIICIGAVINAVIVELKSKEKAIN